METQNKETEAKQYKHQAIVDNSPKLVVKRKVDVKLVEQLATKLIALANSKVEEVEWIYACSPPDRMKADSDNPPAYVPVEPTQDTIDKWLLFQGVDSLIGDTHARQCSRARAHDRDCRSSNFEKFDDETFIKLQSEGPDRTPISELKDQIANIIRYASKGQDPEGDHKPLLPQDIGAQWAKIAALQARIDAKSRSSED